jgi:hypothetical protein
MSATPSDNPMKANHGSNSTVVSATCLNNARLRSKEPAASGSRPALGFGSPQTLRRLLRRPLISSVSPNNIWIGPKNGSDKSDRSPPLGPRAVFLLRRQVLPTTGATPNKENSFEEVSAEALRSELFSPPTITKALPKPIPARRPIRAARDLADVKKLLAENDRSITVEEPTCPRDEEPEVPANYRHAQRHSMKPEFRILLNRSRLRQELRAIYRADSALP